MLDRNRRIKPHPERFQETEEEFDLVVTVEERVYDQVIECEYFCMIFNYFVTGCDECDLMKSYPFTSKLQISWSRQWGKKCQICCPCKLPCNKLCQQK